MLFFDKELPQSEHRKKPAGMGGEAGDTRPRKIIVRRLYHSGKTMHLAPDGPEGKVGQSTFAVSRKALDDAT